MDNLLIDNEEQLKIVVQNVLNDVPIKGDGLKFIGHILSMSQLFDRGFCGNSRDTYLKGRRDLGLEIRDVLMENAFDKYVELLRKGATKDDKQG